MFPLISRKRLLIAGGVLAVTVGTAGGTVLATRPTSASLPSTASSQAAAQPSPTPKSATPGVHKHHGLGGLVLGRVTATPTTSSISIADAAGTVTTYAVSPHVKVSTWNHSQESVTSIPVGELVVLVERHPRAETAPGTGTSSAAAQGQTQPGPAMVLGIRDTGFKAAA